MECYKITVINQTKRKSLHQNDSLKKRTKKKYDNKVTVKILSSMVMAHNKEFVEKPEMGKKAGNKVENVLCKIILVRTNV